MLALGDRVWPSPAQSQNDQWQELNGLKEWAIAFSQKTRSRDKKWRLYTYVVNEILNVSVKI